MTDEPVFQNVAQALHVSFLMAILPVTQKVSTQILIESIRQQLGKTEARIASTINMGGMSPLEFRGQCAMVTAAAHHHLTAPEHAAIRCRYGHQMTKAQGVMALAEYLQARCGIKHDWALRALVWSHYHHGSQRAADRFSLRQIEAETGVPKSTLADAVKHVRDAAAGLEQRAEGRLEVLFARTGLTPEPMGLVCAAL